MANIDGLSQGLQELRDSIAETAQAAPQIARSEIRREGRAYFRGAVVAAVITSLLVGIPLFLLAERFSAYTNADEARTAQLQTSAADIRRLAQGAHDLGVQANAELSRRGLATVPIPTPGTAPDSQVLAAASTAQVAAKIAAETIVVPTPAQIREEIAAQLAKLPPPPVGPAPQQLNDAVQAYLAANSERLRGPRGDQGEPGKSPPCLAEPAQCQGAQGHRASAVSRRWAGRSRRPTVPPPHANVLPNSIRLLRSIAVRMRRRRRRHLRPRQRPHRPRPPWLIPCRSR
jgi:hypothetical protein